MDGSQSAVLALSFAYVAAGVLLLAVLGRLRLARGLKLAAALVAGTCYLAVFFASENLLGWSAPAAVPARFQLLWGRVVEPDRALGRAGAIHLWLEALDDANLPSGVPRAYLLPYSAALAGRVADAQREIKKGHPQGGRAELFGATPDTPPGFATGPGTTPAGGALIATPAENSSASRRKKLRDPRFSGRNSTVFFDSGILPGGG
jgi:hypothetical protein